MSTRTLFLATGAALLVVGAFWLGRSSSEPPPVASAAPVRTASIPAVAVAPARTVSEPVLPARATRAADPTLAADLRDAVPKVRRAAMHEAVREPDVDTKLLVAAARDSDLEVGGTATIALGKAYARGDVSVTELLAIARDTSLHEKVRGVAVNGVGAIASPEAFALLTDLARSSAMSERASAAILLRNQELDRAVPVLIGLLRDSDAHVREVALDSLKSRARGRDFGEDAAAWQAWWASRH